MYVDKDGRGLYSIMDLTPDELETIRRAIKAFRNGMMMTHTFTGKESDKQYIRATNIQRTLSELP